MSFADVIKIFGGNQFRVLSCKVFSEKYCPKRSEGAEIFLKTRRAPTLQDKEDTELPLPKILNTSVKENIPYNILLHGIMAFMKISFFISQTFSSIPHLLHLLPEQYRRRYDCTKSHLPCNQ